jgi:hypothetical protein
VETHISDTVYSVILVFSLVVEPYLKTCIGVAGYVVVEVDVLKPYVNTV